MNECVRIWEQDLANAVGGFIFVCFREVVQLLLAHEASTNILDVKGSSPLHLAAWTGNVDIVRLLLCHGPSVPNVNLTVSSRYTMFDRL